MKILSVHAGRALRRRLGNDLTNWHRRLAKGFVRNGHDVLEFSYLEVLMQFSLVKNGKLARLLAGGRVDRLLAKAARQYQPDMVVLSNITRLGGRVVDIIKQATKGAIYVAGYADQRSGCDPRVVDVARRCDWLIATSGGDVLKGYKRAGVPHCAFVPNMSDPDVDGPVAVPARWRSDIVFTGKLGHKLKGQDPNREALIRYLVEHKNLTVWGCLGRAKVSGLDYVRAICGSRIALSINAFNDVRLYHSDRLTHYLSHGAFVLAKYVPDSELMFEDGKELVYFRSREQCVELIDRFLADDAGRKKIAAAGMQKVHSVFNCRKIAGHIVKIVTTGDCDEPWADVV